MTDFTEETDSKYDLIVKDLQGVFNGDSLKSIIAGGAVPRVYWGTAPTGKIHLGYIIQSLKLRDIVNAGCELIILIADLHAFLDSQKSEESQIEARSEYYIKLMRSLLARLGVDLEKVKFVKGTSFQLNEEYTMDVYRLGSRTTYNHCKHAGSEVVKQEKNVPMTNLMYPILQALDMVHLKCDAFIGGNDQIKINSFGMDFLSSIGYTQRYTYLMTPMIAGISTKKQDATVKMSSSGDSSKVELLFTPEEIKKAISKAYCLEKDIDDNSLLKLCKNLVFKLTNEFPTVKYDGETKTCLPFKTYTSYDELEKDFALGSVDGGLHPADLKDSMTNFFVDFLKPIRDDFDNDDARELIQRAYP